MKKIIVLNLIVVISIGLIYKGPVSFFTSATAASYSSGSNRQVPAKRLPNVEVVTLPLPGAVQASVQAVCQNAVLKSGNLVQDEGAINLNQPANCFSLQITSAKVLNLNLAISSLPVPAKIVVTRSPSFLQNPDFLPSPLDPVSLPAMPAVSLAVLATTLILRKKIIATLLNLKNNQWLFVNTGCLEVLRC